MTEVGGQKRCTVTPLESRSGLLYYISSGVHALDLIRRH